MEARQSCRARERNGEAEQVKGDGDECFVSMNEPTIFFIYLNT